MRTALHWYLQRVTGGLLVILLAAHFWVEHFMTAELQRGSLTYASVHARVSNPVWQVIDTSFLLIALYHGLSGLRNIVLDYSRFSPRAVQFITAVLAVFGIVWAYWGVTAFRNL
jgi:succinate dehydrogenase hydrophobic anchor subunit